jgi:hypothetical protein
VCVCVCVCVRVLRRLCFCTCHSALILMQRQYMIRNGANVRGKLGQDSALAIACRYERLSFPADSMNSINSLFNASALACIFRRGCLEIVEVLVKAGTEDVWQCLAVAERHGHKDIAKLLQQVRMMNQCVLRFVAVAAVRTHSHTHTHAHAAERSGHVLQRMRRW